MTASDVERDIGEIKANIHHNKKVIEQLQNDVRELRRSHDRSKGFWGGMMFAASALSAFIALLVKRIFFNGG
ncbi:hypothetical protein LCGC14_2359040 [marine sediment metagenome]|uniref:Uncharacterized protein n=1 Tax=marine sediment metagenome TaxID=412755 RepID=A0A0F9F1Z6_9ZZZZ